MGVTHDTQTQNSLRENHASSQDGLTGARRQPQKNRIHETVAHKTPDIRQQRKVTHRDKTQTR